MKIKVARYRKAKFALLAICSLLLLGSEAAGQLIATGTINGTGAFTNYVNTNPNVTDQMDIMGKLEYDISPRFQLTGEYFSEGQTFTGANAARMGSPFATNYDTFSTSDQAGQIALTQNDLFVNGQPDEHRHEYIYRLTILAVFT